MSTELLDRAATATMCQVLGAIGTSLVGAPVFKATGPVGTAVSMTAGAAMLLASNYACAPMDLDGEPPTSNTVGCIKVCGGTAILLTGKEGGSMSPYNDSHSGDGLITEITDVEIFSAVDGNWYNRVHYKWGDGSTGSALRGTYQNWSEKKAREVVWGLQPQGEATCCGDSGGPTHSLPDGYDDPISYVDDSTNCTYNVSFQGFVERFDGGPAEPVFLIEGTETQRTGGRMGGCNFSPTIYLPGGNGGGGGGGGGITVPVPDGGAPGPGPDGVPWWVPALGGALGGAVVNQLVDAIDDLFAPTFEPGSFTLTAPCDVDDAGNPQFRTWEFAEGSFQERMNAHQVAMMEMLQQHLDWKTPTCDCNESDSPEGDFRTISFRSDETSPYGKSRLRKRFRYRSVSGNDLGAVVDHWKDFTFEGGPYRVRWIGKSWRSPEVWAASEAEGQRVIQHAAGEAGVGPLEDGRWSTRVSSSARLGVSGTMRIDTTGGYYWITARDGSSERPIVAKT